MRSTFHDQMPELPEVQTIVNDLQVLIGDTITDFQSVWKKSIKEHGYADFNKKITGKKILSVERVGKFVVINISQNLSIMIHLRMTGQLLIMDRKAWNLQQKTNKHIHHVFYLKKKHALAFSDIRKFGTITLIKTTELPTYKSITVLGIDALDPKLDAKKLSELLLKNKNKQIKDFLLRQDVISGIGNIYASEILFDAKILPTKLCKDLSQSEINVLSESIKKILEKAIQMRGTSVSDYRDSNQQKGSFQNALMVYKKGGQECKRCGTMVEKMVIGQRSTFYCPKCQK